MTFQNINVPIETSINFAFNNILNSFRYNFSNWIYVDGADVDSFEKRREQDEFILSTNTKRFMCIIVRKSKYETDDVLPLYKIRAFAFIDGDYQHSITQTNDIGSKYIDSNLQDDGYWLHYSYVVFDFTADEVKNSITVTNSDGVPTKGLFTMQLEGTDDKKLERLPFNSYIRFATVGSGIDTSNFSYFIYNQMVSSGFMDVTRDIMTGEMIGYSTKNTANIFTIDDTNGYPNSNLGFQNIVIPVGAIDISDSYNPDFTIDFKTLSNKPFNDELLNLKQKCIFMSEDQIGLLKVKQNNITINETQTLASRREYQINYIPCPKNGEILIVKESGTTWSLKSNNLLILEPLCDIYNEDGILPTDVTPLVLPQTDKNISSYRPIDDGIINYIQNLYKIFHKSKEYCLSHKNTYGDGDIYFKIHEIELPCFTKSDNSSQKANYNIKVENWNSDTTHNIYIDLFV